MPISRAGSPSFLMKPFLGTIRLQRGYRMASLTDYVLRLARDPAEHEKFRKSRDSATQAMDAAGLKDEHKKLLLDGDSASITQAITSELPASAALQGAYNSCTLTMTLGITLNRPA